MRFDVDLLQNKCCVNLPNVTLEKLFFKIAKRQIWICFVSVCKGKIEKQN